ncbi:hypothetical protein H5410_061597 [Solanum commersonii]|uniref:Uncharacterized protein n=1 Tax=Solanum commersonii TaxID=4109 RepID=A0A9J5W939_SOLCO|nr:hypothetical protein H5410_061597 [Solanum commersonii]
MGTTIDEIMDLLYEDQKIAPKKLGKHGTVIKNDAEQTFDSMIRVLKESANEVVEETMNDVLAETIMTIVKLNKEEDTNANEYIVLKNAQGNNSQTSVGKDSADIPFKYRKLVRLAFYENNCRSDLNDQLTC